MLERQVFGERAHQDCLSITHNKLYLLPPTSVISEIMKQQRGNNIHASLTRVNVAHASVLW